MTSRNPTTATTRQETIETPPNGDGSVTFLRSDDAGSQALSLRPAQEPATNSTPTVIRSSDVSDMSLTEAAYWIATEGGSREFNIHDAEIWKSAFDQVLKKIRGGELTVLGRRFDKVSNAAPPFSTSAGTSASRWKQCDTRQQSGAVNRHLVYLGVFT
jgi:hypothetical protein